ncbi:PQQ-dependent sugar dehydrogenase [Parahaliea aestuarii]|uniref:Sorbosone dehydrogenase family protein n=1 Tax=Parahaliea aestuarii TaxID=1852021 RepID=A0A5C8ZP21_9GAMM|nr:PQQ-dependent sugar dehydrogenase [Parahaliea aestuarii]TXS89985.1 sorbosone dehydrogenase family protein [Parahaliea aestuarii]
MRWVSGLLAMAMAGCAAAAELPLEKLNLPEGFVIEVYVDDVANARQMALGDAGTLFIGTRAAGDVYAVEDSDGDGRPDAKRVIASELARPSGVAVHEGDLYVAEVSQIRRYPAIESQLASGADLEFSIFVDGLPTEEHHGWKYIDFGPDGHLYVPVGAPCNICDEEEPFATILRVAADGSDYQVYARGVRNSVGFDWHPQTGELWFTDNGRDMMGDDIPDCELNRVSTPGEHFGYPYFHAGDVRDPEYGEGKDPGDYTAPVAKLGAHVAPLGMYFYEGEAFPEAYRHLFIVEHGSWNRSKKVGYQVKMAVLEGNEVTAYRPFIDGWLNNDEDDSYWGRPVALLPLVDGSLLLSDDYAGVVYRVSYRGQ